MNEITRGNLNGAKPPFPVCQPQKFQVMHAINQSNGENFCVLSFDDMVGFILNFEQVTDMRLLIDAMLAKLQPNQEKKVN